MTVPAKDANRNTWYKGLFVGVPEFNEHEDNIAQGDKARAAHTTGWGLHGTTGNLALASTPADLVSNVAPAKMVTPDGYLVEWVASEPIDVSTATAGSLKGDTSAPTVGAKRYIVTTVAHSYLDTEARTDDLGATVYYRQVSEPEFFVWQSSEVTAADVPHTSTILRNLITSIVAANHAPLGLCVRSEGASTIDAANMFEIPRLLCAHGEDIDHARQLEQHLLVAGGLGLPLVLTTNGQIAVSSQAVGGQPGKITFAGGERVIFGIPGDQSFNNQYAEDTYGNRMITKEIPAAEEVNFPLENTTYVVRCYVDPLTLDLVIYKGTGDFPNDGKLSNNAHGSEGGSGIGFLPTWIDIPVAVVETGLNGTAPNITTVPTNDWSSKLAFLEQQSYAVNDKVAITDYQPVENEFEVYDQPYVNVTKDQLMMINVGALDLRIYQLSVLRGHANGETLVPSGATAFQDITLGDNMTSLIYIDMTANPPNFQSSGIVSGGGINANPSFVVLGVATTSGGLITNVVANPTDRATALKDGVDCSFIQVANLTDITVGPTIARQQIGKTSGTFPKNNTVYQSPFVTTLDHTAANNWVDQTIFAAAGWKYLYADPGSSHFGDLNYVTYKLSTLPPNYLGRHISYQNLLYIGAVYLDGGSNLIEMYKSDDHVSQLRQNVLVAGAAGVATPINLSAVVPLTAHTVFIMCYSTLGGGPGTLNTSFYRLAGGAEFGRVQFTGATGEVQTSHVMEIPVDYNAGTPQIYYDHLVGGGGAFTISVNVVGYRERKFGNMAFDNPITIAY